jgi:uracil DNA glycosylase
MSILNFCEAIRMNGGASYNLNTGELNPAHGFMVSIKGFEVTVPFIPETVENVVKLYMKGTINELIKDGIMLGAWIHQGFLILDLSVLVETAEEASALCEKNEQQAYFDNVNKKSIFPKPETPD